jgi:thioredoxin 1
MVEVKKFSASWCGPCKLLAPVMESIKPKFNNVRFTNVDVDEQFEIASKYGIRSVPTVVIEKNGQEVKRISGSQSEIFYTNVINEQIQ